MKKKTFVSSSEFEWIVSSNEMCNFDLICVKNVSNGYLKKLQLLHVDSKNLKLQSIIKGKKPFESL